MVLSKKFYVVSISVFVVLMGILAIGDLDYTISEALVNPNSLIGQTGNLFGEFPAMFGMLLAVVLLYGGRRRDIMWWNVVATILGVIFIFLFSYTVVMMPIRYAFEHAVNGTPTIWKIINVVGAIILAGASIYIAHTKGENFKDLKKHAWLLLVLIFGEVFIVNIVKGIWARPRMRSISSVSEFKHWYEINGWTNDNELKSFPSGHTANAFISLAYMIFIPYIKSIKMKTYITIAVVWGVFVSLSRVIIGAHFLSDVLVGSYITIFLFILLEKVFFRNMT